MVLFSGFSRLWLPQRQSSNKSIFSLTIGLGYIGFSSSNTTIIEFWAIFSLRFLRREISGFEHVQYSHFLNAGETFPFSFRRAKRVDVSVFVSFPVAEFSRSTR